MIPQQRQIFLSGNEATRVRSVSGCRENLNRGGHCLTVPVESVGRNADGRPVINLVRREDFKSTVQRTVQTGLRDGDTIEVHGEGLRAGQLVVTTRAYGLPARAEIHVVEP